MMKLFIPTSDNVISTVILLIYIHFSFYTIIVGVIVGVCVGVNVGSGVKHNL